MALASWLVLSATSGSGNQTINVSSNVQNTGRNDVTTVIAVKASGCTDKNITITHQGKPEFVSAPSSQTAKKTGETITITGTSNSAKLTFSLGTGDLNISAPTTFKIGTNSYTSGTAITNDPGASGQYTWTAQITVPSNPTIVEKTKQFIVTDAAGNQSICTIRLAAGDPTLSVSKTAITIPWEGTPAQSFSITSNTSWTIE